MQVIRVRQTFSRPRENDVAQAIRREFAQLGVGERLQPGATVAVPVGSRGIINIPLIIREVISELRSAGAEPFVVAAMGSHGGGTVEGQREVLHKLGITPETVGAEVHAGTRAIQVGTASTGQAVFCEERAASAAAIFVVNRVKMHTTFRGELESGLFKMMAVGLGKEPGARSFHSAGQPALGPAVVAMGRCFLDTMPVVGGLAILENGYEETAGVFGLSPEEIEVRERELQARAKELFPRLPVDRLDLLVVEELGKDVSGTGMDSNVIGRMRLDGEPDLYPPKIDRIVALGLSPGTGDNGYGIGLADFTTTRVAERLDRQAMAVNALATGFLAKAFVPLLGENDRQAIELAIRSLGRPVKRYGRIKNTLELHELELSPLALTELRPGAKCQAVSHPYEWSYDDDGGLLSLDEAGSSQTRAR